MFQNLSTPGEFTAGSLSPRTDFRSGWNAWGLGIADLDADGRPEAVFANAYDDTITIYRNISPVAGPPFILSQPTDRTVAVGEDAALYVQAIGTPDLAYQWWRAATLLDGATSNSLTISGAQFNDSGKYYVVITNSYGAATSQVAVLTVTNLAPYITTQPQSRTAMLNSTTEFVVVAGGTRPLSYQWQFNGTNLPGAVSSVLTVTNVQLQNAGTYAVEVSNSLGSLLSSNAVLAVITPPANVGIPNTNTPSGWPVTVPVLLTANGNENAVSFSVNFAQARSPMLRYVGTTLGAGAAGASLVVNTNLLNLGFLGVAVALPAGNTFSPGTQEVVEVTFDTEVITFQQTTSQLLSFLDNPIPRQLTDTLARSLPANFSYGRVILLPSDVEGDTAPRPGGNRSLTLNDWVQAGRFAAGLDIPYDAFEFQRADCAPRETRGDGHIKVTDWVQAGRYFGKLDPLMAAGGPTSPAPSKTASKDEPVNGPGDRQVLVGNAAGVTGASLQLPVLLAAQGDENALGFSLAYDPLQLQYNGVAPGSDAAAAMLNLNTLQPGNLGVALAFNGNELILKVPVAAEPRFFRLQHP